MEGTKFKSLRPPHTHTHTQKHTQTPPNASREDFPLKHSSLSLSLWFSDVHCLTMRWSPADRCSPFPRLSSSTHNYITCSIVSFYCRSSFARRSTWTAMSWLSRTTCSYTTTPSTGEGLADSTLQKVRLLIWRMVGTLFTSYHLPRLLPLYCVRVLLFSAPLSLFLPRWHPLILLSDVVLFHFYSYFYICRILLRHSHGTS